MRTAIKISIAMWAGVFYAIHILTSNLSVAARVLVLAIACGGLSACGLNAQLYRLDKYHQQTRVDTAPMKPFKCWLFLCPRETEEASAMQEGS